MFQILPGFKVEVTIKSRQLFFISYISIACPFFLITRSYLKNTLRFTLLLCVFAGNKKVSRLRSKGKMKQF